MTSADHPSWIAAFKSIAKAAVLHSERVKLAAKALDSTNQYGWKLGAYVERADRAPFTIEELHKGKEEEIVSLFNQANADLISLDLILPDKFIPQVTELKRLLEEVQLSFQAGYFSKLTTLFHLYREQVDSLRQDLREFLLID